VRFSFIVKSTGGSEPWIAVRSVSRGPKPHHFVVPNGLNNIEFDNVFGS
jgi:hypothetical protein